MKTYIKPNTKVQNIELTQMIAVSAKVDTTTEVGNETPGWTDLSKKNNFSLWGDSEEEE